MEKKVIKKKVVKKTVVKSAPKVDQRKCVDYKSHFPFMAVIALVVGFSGYAIFSSYSSNSNLLDYSYASIANGDVGKIGSTAFATKGAATGINSLKPSPFSDVKYGDANADAIIALYYAGVVNGYSDGTFKPNSTVNRAEFMKMLAEARDVDYAAVDSAMLANCFNDVKDVPEHWYAPPVCAGKYYGWVNGYIDGSFKPSQNINKAEALKITLVAFGFEVPANKDLKERPYPDVASRSLLAMTASDANLTIDSPKFSKPLASWYAGVAKAAKDAGLISKDGNFDAGHDLTRGEMAAIIYKAMIAKSDL